MTARPEHTTVIDTVVAIEVTEVLELFVEMCDLFDWPQPLGEALRRVTDGRYELLCDEAVDEVRRDEVKSRPELRRSRYLWLKNESYLTDKQKADLLWLTRPSMQLKTARAARWRDDFNVFYEQETHEDAEFYLKRWCDRAKRSRLEPVRAFIRTVESHFDGVLAWQDKRITNGLLEGTNSLIQAAKRRARGYRSKEKMITIIYLITGKLPLPQIHTI